MFNVNTLGKIIKELMPYSVIVGCLKNISLIIAKYVHCTIFINPLVYNYFTFY
jgi:hypothetical protein